MQQVRAPTEESTERISKLGFTLPPGLEATDTSVLSQKIAEELYLNTLSQLETDERKEEETVKAIEKEEKQLTDKVSKSTTHEHMFGAVLDCLGLIGLQEHADSFGVDVVSVFDYF